MEEEFCASCLILLLLYVCVCVCVIQNCVQWGLYWESNMVSSRKD